VAKELNTKNLYILIQDGGDGSYNPVFTLDKTVIDQFQQRYDEGELEHGEPGVDGDGFHYTTLTVPADASYESLGISKYSVVDNED
jgi:hypothetical protein